MVFYCCVFINLINLEFTETNNSDFVELRDCYRSMRSASAFGREKPFHLQQDSNVRDAIELYLNESANAGESIPDAVTTKVDFHEFDPDHEAKQYFVEWLAVSLPQSGTHFQAA